MESSRNREYNQLYFMIFLTLLTQLINLIKLSATASNFGVTVEMDAFNFSNSIGTFLFSFISTGITTVIIPAIINNIDKKSINNFITIIYVVSLFIVINFVIFRKNIITTFSTGTPEFIVIASNVMLITLVTQFLNTILGVTNAVFQCNGKYNIPKIITLGTSCLLAIIIIINSNMNIYEYSFYIFITGFINTTINMYIVRRDGFKYKFFVNLKDENMRNMFKVFMPTVFSAGLYQISLLTDSMISSRLGQGQISVLTYSNSIMSMINMLFVGNIMTYIYPRITKEASTSNGKRQVFEYFKIFNFIIFLLVVGFIVVGKEGISILYQRGNFSEEVTDIVYKCTFIYMIGLPINVMRDIIYRYFYARGDTKITFYNSVSASIFNIIISILLSKFIGVYGIILGTVVTSLFSFISIIIRFHRRYSIDFDNRNIILENVKIIVASILTIIISLLLKYKFIISNLIMSILIYGVAVCIIYILVLVLMKTNIHRGKI